MLTINAIVKELKDVPVNRLEELHQFISSLSPRVGQTDNIRKKILSYGGAFRDMSDRDYADFIEHTRKARKTLFNRDIDI